MCHYKCHIFGSDAVHRNKSNMLVVKRYGQQKAMREQSWTEDDFRREFGKNYL